MLSSAISIVRSWLSHRPVQIFISYAGGSTVPSGIGPTLLEITRSNRVPHLSVSGDRRSVQRVVWKFLRAEKRWIRPPRSNFDCCD